MNVLFVLAKPMIRNIYCIVMFASMSVIENVIGGGGQKKK
jgi:hypothetical protein